MKKYCCLSLIWFFHCNNGTVHAELPGNLYANLKLWNQPPSSCPGFFHIFKWLLSIFKIFSNFYVFQTKNYVQHQYENQADHHYGIDWRCSLSQSFAQTCFLKNLTVAFTNFHFHPAYNHCRIAVCTDCTVQSTIYIISRS